METWELESLVDDLYERNDSLIHAALGRLAALALGTTPPILDTLNDSSAGMAQQ